VTGLDIAKQQINSYRGGRIGGITVLAHLKIDVESNRYVVDEVDHTSIEWSPLLTGELS
jgi:hypothetical protein